MKRLLTMILVSLMMTSVPARAAVVVLDILFDDFPEETAFGVWEVASAPTLDDFINGKPDYFGGIAYDVDLSSPIGVGDGFALPGDFLNEPPGPWQFVWNVNPGIYVFAITDTFGDGICCGFGEGSFSLTVDGNVAISGGAFGSFALVKFESVTPIPVPGALLLLGSALAGWVGFGRRSTFK